MGDKGKLVAVQVTFKNMEATEALKQYANEKLSTCLKKYIHQNTEVHLVLKVEKKRQMAEISFHSDGADFKNSETSEDMYKSIDALVDSLNSQLRKHKEKITSHH